ncbi:MAG: EVE domain-containing protein [Flammeovirgaceae bacterium]|nr:EVE domain-containing protein [Flammeovirgaceae bacterium]
MNYWLLKTEPNTFGWNDLVKEKKSVWDGVRNFQARKNLKSMSVGDLAFIYHTGDEKSVVGIAKVIKAPYPEPKDKNWIAVDISPSKKLKNPVSLAEVKATKKLEKMVLVRVSRLSVQPVSKSEFESVISMSEKTR